MRILILPYNVDYPCLWTVHVIQSCITITVMYHEPRQELYYTGNTITRETKYLGDLCCKISINVSTCNISIFILSSIHIKNTWQYINAYSFSKSIIIIFLNPGISELY